MEHNTYLRIKETLGTKRNEKKSSTMEQVTMADSFKYLARQPLDRQLLKPSDVTTRSPDWGKNVSFKDLERKK